MSIHGQSQKVRGSAPDGSAGRASGASMLLYGGVQTPPTPAVRTTVEFDDYILDTPYPPGYLQYAGGFYNITIPAGRAGLYMVSAGVDLVRIAIGMVDTLERPWIMAVVKNGTDDIAYQQVTQFATTAYDVMIESCTVQYLAEDDVLTIEVDGPTTTSGGTTPGYTIQPGVGLTYLAVAWLGFVPDYDVYDP